MQVKLKILFLSSFLLLAVFLFPRLASAATYYVDTAAGNNSNNGSSWGLAFKQMIKASTVASDGDTVYVKSGTYVEGSAVGGVTGYPTFSKAITWIADDGSGNAGTVTVQSYDSSWVVFISNANSTQSFTGFIFDGQTTKAYIAKFQNAGNKTFTNCTFKDATTTQIYSDSSNTATNTFTNTSLTQSLALSSSMIDAYSGGWIFTSATITNNISGTHITVNDRASNTYALTFTSCNMNILGGATYGIQVSGGASVVFDGNTIVGNFSTGNLIYNAGGASAVTINNNTITMSGAGGGYLYYGVGISRVNAGNFNLTNNTININSDFTGFKIARSNITITVTGNTVNHNTTTGASDIFSFSDPTSVSISNNTINDSYTAASSHSIIVILPQYPTEFSGGTIYIGYNTISYNNTAGKAIQIGEDFTSGSTYEQKYNGAIIEHNTIYGPGYNSGNFIGGYHNVLIGHQTGVHIRYNKFIGTAIAIVWKSKGLDMGHLGGVYNNVFINNAYDAILNKGNVNLDIYNNTFYVDSTVTSNNRRGIETSRDGDPNYATGSGTHIFNNVFYWLSTQNVILVDSYSKTGVVLNNNLYYNELGTQASQVYSWNDASVTGFANWKTASGNDANSSFANPAFVSLGTNLALLPTSPVIDAGTSSRSTADYANHSIYGLPDLGAYEYQPAYTFAANNIPTTGSARLYSNGRFLMTTASSTLAVANFSVRPSDGYRSTTTAYMDLTINTWQTSGDKNKQWTATSTVGSYLTHATSTTYVIGDLLPNKYYQFKLDNTASTAFTSAATCTGSFCLADGSGNLTFTYTGGYSTHTFALQHLAVAPTPTNFTAELGDHGINLHVDTFINDTLGSAGYSFANTTTGATSGWISTNHWIDTSTTCGNAYTYTIKYRNGESVETATVSVTKNTTSCGSGSGGGSGSGSGNTPSVTQNNNSTTNNNNNPTTTTTTTNTNDANTNVDVSETPSTSDSNASSDNTNVAVNITTPSNVDELLTNLGLERNQTRESQVQTQINQDLKEFKLTTAKPEDKTAMTNFVVYGISDATVKLGAGERRAVLRDYLDTTKFTSVNWEDVERITTGQKPVNRNLAQEQAKVNQVLASFQKAFGHKPDFKNQKDDLAWNTMMYRIRFERDLTKEKQGTVAFQAKFKRSPKTPLDWSTVRALGYIS